LKIAIVAHCTVIVDPQGRNAQQHQFNLFYTSLKSILVGYNFVSDNTGLSLFFQPLLPPKSSKLREIPRKFKLIALQGHRFWCQSKVHMQLSTY